MTDLDLVRTYWPVTARPAFDALFALDSVMADVVRTTSEPMLGAIRLAWWRDRLEGLDAGEIPAEPRLIDAVEVLFPLGITGAMLAELERGWTVMLEPFPWTEDAAQAVARRGVSLFEVAADILQTDQPPAGFGALYALTDVARRCSDRASAEAFTVAAREHANGLRSFRAPKGMRPLTMLTALAARDLDRWPEIEAEATPARAVTLLRHRLTGRLPLRD